MDNHNIEVEFSLPSSSTSSSSLAAANNNNSSIADANANANAHRSPFDKWKKVLYGLVACTAIVLISVGAVYMSPKKSDDALSTSSAALEDVLPWEEGGVCVSPPNPVATEGACCTDSDCIAGLCLPPSKYCYVPFDSSVDCSAGRTCTENDDCLDEESCDFLRVEDCSPETRAIGGTCDGDIPEQGSKAAKVAKASKGGIKKSKASKSSPTFFPTYVPTRSPSYYPSTSPTKSPSSSPTTSPSKSPSSSPTMSPSKSPSSSPSKSPSKSPSSSPSTSPTKNPSQSPSSSPTEVCPGGIVPQLELAENCVTSNSGDLNDCSFPGSPDPVTLSSSQFTKICGKTSTYDDGAFNTDGDVFVFSLNQGGIRIILNVPGSTFKARMNLGQVNSEALCGVLIGDFVGAADSNTNSGPDQNGIIRYVPGKLDGSADYIITASSLPAGTYRLSVVIDIELLPGGLSCSATGGGLPYTIEVEEDWIGPTV